MLAPVTATPAVPWDRRLLDSYGLPLLYVGQLDGFSEIDLQNVGRQVHDAFQRNHKPTSPSVPGT